MRKGITGKIITVIISLIIAVVALAILWMFLNKSTELIPNLVEGIVHEIRCKLCFSIRIGPCASC